ncbi:MAG TPA: hypothetical protein VKY22_29405 [Bradyrhizobium sp.]|nr:hypothetical protein [Bradyrhizobium sp.]
MSDAPSSAPASGPASANDAQLTGRFAEEAKHGFREMPSDTTDKSDKPELDARKAADQLAKARIKSGRPNLDEPRPQEYRDEQGRKAPKNETVSLKRASDDLKQSRLADASAAEINDRDDLARNIDNLRKEAGVPTDPTAPVDPNQIDPHLFGDLPDQAAQIDPQHLPQDMQPAPPGIDPDLHRAFQNPKIRQAVETEFNKAVTTATTAQKHYAANVQAAQEIALGSINAAFPEMNGIKTPQQMATFLNQLQQTNPQRFQQAQIMLNNFTRLHNERQHMERQRQQIDRQNFQREAAVQDQAFAKRVQHVPPQQREAVAREALSYAASLGVDQRTFEHLMMTNPIMRHAAFRKMMFDAAAYSLAQKNLTTTRQQQRAANIPPVIRPGTSNGGGVRAVQNASLQQLSARLTQSGDAKDAAALLMAMRSQRRR